MNTHRPQIDGLMPTLGCRRFARRGIVLYLTTLCVALALTLVAVTTAATMVSQARANTLTSDTEQARVGAVSAMEFAIQACNANPSWRTAHTHAAPVIRTMNQVKLTYTIFDDADSLLANDDGQPVRIVSVGEFGASTQRARLVARPRPLSCLESDVVAGGRVQVGTGNGLTVDVKASANDRVENTGTITGAVESSNTTSNSGVITGQIANGVKSKEMPTAATMNYYISRASAINFASLPVSAGTKSLRNTLISPTENPYGTTNAQGIYIIDCGGSNLMIDSCRIVGTLILVNPGSGSDIRNSVHWVAAVSNFPALMISGNMTINLTGATLNEADAGTNFNPASTPYQGVSDVDIAGVYPCLLQGIVYATGNLTLTGATRIDGVVVGAGNVPVTGLVAIKYLSLYANNPPPGFFSHRLGVASGSWNDQ